MSSVADGLPLNKRLPAVIAISLGIGMATLDTAIVNTALPTLAEGIGTDSASVIWVVNAYQLAIIATVLPFASLSEVLGHRRVYLGGLLLFIVSSLFCGLAGSLETLTAARVVQGLGAAAIMSVNTALLRHIYPSRMLGRGLGYNSLVVGLAFTLGPTAASAILSVTTWHWLYLINVPLGVLALALGLRSLPTLPMTGHAFDRLAAVLCAGLFALLVLGLGTAVHGAQGALTLGLIAVALLCGALLLRRQAGHPAPMPRRSANEAPPVPRPTTWLVPCDACDALRFDMTCSMVVMPCFFRSSIFKIVMGTDVSPSIRLMAEPVISTRWIGVSDCCAIAGWASMVRPAMTAPPVNIKRKERDKTVSIIIANSP